MDFIKSQILQALVAIRKQASANKVKPGIVDNLSGLVFLMQKIRKYGEPKTIGFFGAQKRGKSSLINQLLGCRLMPVKSQPMSSVVVKVKQDKNLAVQRFNIDVIDENGMRDTHVDVTLEDAQMIIEQYGGANSISWNLVLFACLC